MLRPAAMDLPRPVAALQSQLVDTWPGAVDGAHPLNVRLAVRGPNAVLLLDQLTVAHTAAAVGEDPQARQTLAAHLALGATLPRFGGIRLLAPRAPLASRHYLDPSTWHRVGGCPNCAIPTGVTR